MRILLAVDGSDYAYEATRALAHLARAEHLIVLHVMDVPTPMYPTVVPEVAREVYETVERGMREEGDRLLQRITSLLPLNVGPVVKRLEVGKPTSLILAAAVQEQADLIVMGARGVGQVREMMLGSVSHQVITHAPCPVLVVGMPMRALRRVFLAVEGPDDADAAVRALSMRPFKEPCEVTVLTVLPYAHPAWPVGAMIPESFRKDMTAQAKVFVDDVATRLQAAGYRATGEAVMGAPATEILQAVSKHQADLILIGSRSRGISRLVLGSVSHTILHKTPCPVLVVR